MRNAPTLLPLAAALLLWACDDGGSAAPAAEDTPLPPEATQGVDQGLPNPDAAQPPSETTPEATPPSPGPLPPAATETTVDDAPPDQIGRPDPAPPADPAGPSGLPAGESVDVPPGEEADEPTEPMA